MTPAKPRILTINGGSSSIKFALFEASDSFQRILEGGIDRVGLPNATLRVKGINPADNFSKPIAATVILRTRAALRFASFARMKNGSNR